MPGIVIDIGTGDGSFVYQMAKEHPDRLFIGIDPSNKGLERLSAKSLAKLAKGGLQNIMFVLARIEELPEELNGQANQIFINFPWAGLLEGIVAAEPNGWHNIRRICQSGAFVDVLFGYQEIYERTAILERRLPVFDNSYINRDLVSRLNALKFELVDYKTVSGRDLKTYPSSWAKRLGHGRERTFHYLRAKAI